MEVKTVYFENLGKENTDEVLRVAKQRAEELGIKSIVLASSSGETAIKAVDVFKGLKVIVVTLSTGFRKPNFQKFTDENRKIVESKGGIVYTGIHTFAGVSKAMKYKFDTLAIGDIIASSLYIFGNGMKVACEISMMAADAGLVRTDETIIAIAGSGEFGGSDTAIVLTPVNSHNFFDLKIQEILCKPHF